MKSGNKKSYINISDLVSTYNKENKCNNTRPSSRRSINEPNSKPIEDKQLFQRTLKLDRQIFPLGELKMQSVTSSCKKQSNAGQMFFNKRKTMCHPKIDIEESLAMPQKQGEKLQMLESLIGSEKMFIDPDRWESFLSKAQNDEKFHRALSAFLYSYFIQNYQ